MLRICISISIGWSPTGTFVKPGKSIRVKLRTKKKNQKNQSTQKEKINKLETHNKTCHASYKSYVEKLKNIKSLKRGISSFLSCNEISHLAIPSGSTDFASMRASEVARSTLAGVTARMRQVSLEMNVNIISRICASMSRGWSPTGILVRPGKSISVMFSTVQQFSCHDGNNSVKEVQQQQQQRTAQPARFRAIKSHKHALLC